MGADPPAAAAGGGAALSAGSSDVMDGSAFGLGASDSALISDMAGRK